MTSIWVVFSVSEEKWLDSTTWTVSAGGGASSTFYFLLLVEEGVTSRRTMRTVIKIRIIIIVYVD